MTNEELLQKLRQCGRFLHHMPDGRMSQRRILGILSEEDGITQRDLQERLEIRSASMSEILGKIEGEGLIERRPSPEDRRSMRVRLSDEGRQVAAALAQANQRQTAELLSCLNEEEKEQLGGYLDRLQKHWQERFGDREEPRDPRGPHPFGHGGPHHPGPGGPHGHHGFEEGPHGRDEEGRGPRAERTLPGRPGPASFWTLPGHDDGGAPTTLDGEPDGCIHDCKNCRLREEGRCVRRVHRRA